MGTVDDVDDAVWRIFHYKGPGHSFFWRVRGHGIDSWNVHQSDFFVAFNFTFFFVNGYPRPVAHVVGTSGEFIKQAGFSAVGVSYKT